MVFDLPRAFTRAYAVAGGVRSSATVGVAPERRAFLPFTRRSVCACLRAARVCRAWVFAPFPRARRTRIFTTGLPLPLARAVGTVVLLTPPAALRRAHGNHGIRVPGAPCTLDL
jgi:hypothetical protein